MDVQVLRQMYLEDIYSKRNVRAKIKAELTDTDEIQFKFTNAEELLNEWASHSYFPSKDRRIDFLLTQCPLDFSDILTEIMVALSRFEGPVQIQSIVGSVAAMLEYPDIFDAVRTVSEMLAVCVDVGLYDIALAGTTDEGLMMICSCYSLPEELLQYINQTKYLPPMICPPNLVYENYDYDYLTERSSKILRSHNHHDMPLALDVLNLMNQQALSLDLRVLNEIEESKKPLDTAEKANNFHRMVSASRVVYQTMIDSGNRFYLTWKYDKRGRIYCQGYHITCQGSQYKKAILEFADKYVIPLD